MPLARIITRCPQAAQELTGQLHARGFVVEVVSPEQMPDVPADLVIRLDECSVEEALSATTRIADRSTNVFIAPGAIAGERPATSAQIGVNRTVANDKATADAGLQLGSDSATGSPQSDATAAQESEVYVYEDAVLSPLQRLRLPHIKAPKFSIPSIRLRRVQLPKFSFVRIRPQLSGFSLRRFRIPRMPVPDFSWIRTRLSRIQAPKLSLAALRLPRVRVARPEFRLPHFRVHVPRISLQVPRIPVRLRQPNLRIRKPNLSNFSRPKTFPEFSALKARLRMPKQLLPKLPVFIPEINWRPRLRVLPSLRSALLRGSAWRQSATRTRNVRTHTLRISSATFWDTAIAIGILAVCVLLVGGLLHSKTPLPARLTQGSASTLPFTHAKPNLSTAAPVAHATETRKAERITTPEIVALRKPSAQLTKRAVKVSHSKPKHHVSSQLATAQRPRSSDGDADFVAEDVVVHYGNKN